MDLSVEEAFFDRATAASDRPVSFDMFDDSDAFDGDPSAQSLDLEAREQRRAHFTRVVGGIMGMLGVIVLIALARPVPSTPVAEPVSAAPTEVPEIQPSAAPAPSIEVMPTMSVEPEMNITAEPPPVVSASKKPPRAPRVVAPAAPAAPRLHTFVAPPPAVAAPAQADVNRAPPTARFAD